MLIAFRIVLRTVHVAFAIHDLVVTPVDHRTAGDSHLEDLRIRTHQVSCHKTAVAPPVHADAVGIDIRKGFQELDTFYLVRHLVHA